MTRGLLTISFSLFLVSAMMGAFPIPGTNSVSIPSGTILESPSSPPLSSAISIATDDGVIAGTRVTTPSSSTDSATPQLTNVTKSVNAAPPGAGSPELIKILRSEALTSKVPPTTASSGFSRTSASPLTVKQPNGASQKRAADSPQQKWTPSQGQQGQQWYPSQGQQGQQWYSSQGQQGQQRYPSQGQQWHPSQGQQGQGRDQQLGQPYTIQKRAAATAPQGGSPTYRMSALVCNLDTTTRGLIHCSDNKDYYTFEQPSNPANSADPRNRSWSAGTGAGADPAEQGSAGGGGKNWKRSDLDEGNLSKWSQAGAGSGYGSGDHDEWSHYGKGGNKWSKREEFNEGNLSKWSGSGSGHGYDGGDDWSRYGKGGHSGYGMGGKGDKKTWHKRQVPGAAGTYGRPNTGAIPVPINVGLVWDGNSVNLVPPPSSRRGPGYPGGPILGVGGIPVGATVVGADSPAIPVPINVNALVYPDGQMQIFPSAAPN
ncbi:hypothetical protein EC957_003803 [Mortierella hygrophila]|uniref:Uncharacterized protein n=1 Tax=Mortierella hygrophila TaxID=979708 RepID=A0A9P6FEF9_9FUNG|nr:hypothetical protein EC957_003803 [Mortierella hygrophila]